MSKDINTELTLNNITTNMIENTTKDIKADVHECKCAGTETKEKVQKLYDKSLSIVKNIRKNVRIADSNFSKLQDNYIELKEDLEVLEDEVKLAYHKLDRLLIITAIEAGIIVLLIVANLI